MQWDDDTKICIVFRIRFQLLTRMQDVSSQQCYQHTTSTLRLGVICISEMLVARIGLHSFKPQDSS